MGARLGEPVRRTELAALRGGDERLFARLVRRYYPAMLVVSLGYEPSRAAAEALVHGVWRKVLASLDGIEDDAALVDRLFVVLADQAGRAAVERFFRLVAEEVGQPEPAIEPRRFLGADSAWPGWWDDPPQPLPDNPLGPILRDEAVALIERELVLLGPGKRAVITLRDVEGWDSDRVCRVLRISETDQRTLLQRARSRVRRALEEAGR
jgi:RNA polymerase sigma-70 factor (ECF subfamily)